MVGIEKKKKVCKKVPFTKEDLLTAIQENFNHYDKECKGGRLKINSNFLSVNT